ncbi:MAG: cytochrome c biogenesis protein CcdA, partial [Nitratireductor sp.]|nr:cytochrome c biogenesis protein CcdA [Nitratireductor sp.]
LLYREARIQVQRKPAGFLGAYVVGLAFAFGWTPCVGPVLAAVLFVAGAEETAWQGALLLLSYALGIGIPFILAAIFVVPFLGFLRRFSRHLGTVEKVMGGLLVATGLLFITGQMQTLSYLLLEWFPALGTVG